MSILETLKSIHTEAMEKPDTGLIYISELLVP